MKSVLIVGAHPDDETILAGGTIALLTEQGVATHILCATRGEGGELGSPPITTRSDLAAVRETELRCAAKKLGAISVRLLDYVDPVVGPDEELYPFEADFDDLVDGIRRAIDDVAADVVITHGQDGEYGHPAHQLVHQASRVAVQNASDPPLLYSFAARVPGIDDHIWNENDPAHLALDIRPWLDAKEAAAMCHETQHGLFRRRHPGETMRELLRKTEAFRRHIPLVDGTRPDDAFAALLLAAGAWMPSHT